MIRVGVAGGTGYTGQVLLDLLLQHSAVELCCVTSQSQLGRRLDAVLPTFRGRSDIVFEALDTSRLAQQDVVFCALPSGQAMHLVPSLLAADTRVVDLSADFRLRDAALWQHWYGMPHSSPSYLSRAVYGLSEFFSEQIAGADLVANPGCYPTAVLLALLPLAERGLLPQQTIFIDAKSGLTGAGRQPRTELLFCEQSENMQAYALSGHRHQPEMLQCLQDILQSSPPPLLFVPHLVPLQRGLEAAIYLPSQDHDALACCATHYRNAPCVDVLPSTEVPRSADVRGRNICRLGGVMRAEGQLLLSVLDNLLKGAAGQAVQNMNLMFDLPPTSGLQGIPMQKRGADAVAVSA